VARQSIHWQSNEINETGKEHTISPIAMIWTLTYPTLQTFLDVLRTHIAQIESAKSQDVVHLQLNSLEHLVSARLAFCREERYETCQFPTRADIVVVISEEEKKMHQAGQPDTPVTLPPSNPHIFGA
jgi:uncharacterized protein involved in propanediol utilization